MAPVPKAISSTDGTGSYAQARPSLSSDPLVEHPSHYNFSKFEVIDVLQAWFAHNALLWQVVKYCARAEHKGHYRQDLEKAQFYLNVAVEEAKAQEAKPPEVQG